MNLFRATSLLGVLWLLVVSGAEACTLYWDYADHSWIDGYRVYQAGAEVGAALPADREGDCTALGIVPGSGSITMTAYRGEDESPHSDPATLVIVAPGGVRLQLTM